MNTSFLIKLPNGQEYDILPVKLKDYATAYQHYVLALGHSDSTVPNIGIPAVYDHIVQAMLWLGMPYEVIKIMTNDQVIDWMVYSYQEGDEEKLPVSGKLWLLNGCWEHSLQRKLDQGRKALKDQCKPPRKALKANSLSIGAKIRLALGRKLNERKQV